MTPAEQIAYLREWAERNTVTTKPTILAVCDLAERALLTDDDRDAIATVLAWLETRRLAGVKTERAISVLTRLIA